jgi:phosphoserine phosphatase
LFIATLVAKDRLDAGDISAACDALRGKAGPVVDGVACDVSFMGSGESRSPVDRSAAAATSAPAFAGARAALEAALPHLDVIVQRAADRQRELLVADMDSTMITVECIDELADYVGLKAEVSAVTERAMRGEIDFAGALRDRVKLLAGLSEATIAECLAERVRPMGGAKALITALRGAGGRAVLVSGGFTHFTNSVARDLGFDRAVANRLVVRNGELTGEVEQPIVDAQTKRETLIAEAKALGVPLSATLAIGDGANDIPMIEAAGLGIAFHAKPKTEAAADARVRHGDLSVVRYALGIS